MAQVCEDKALAFSRNFQEVHSPAFGCSIEVRYTAPGSGIVAEYHDRDALWADHVDNAVIDAMLEQAESGAAFEHAAAKPVKRDVGEFLTDQTRGERILLLGHVGGL